MDYKRHLPQDNGIHSLHVAINRIWDAIESSGASSTSTTKTYVPTSSSGSGIQVVYVTGSGGSTSTGGGTTTTTTGITTLAQLLALLGYTPVNKAGDSGVGDISMANLTAVGATFTSGITGASASFAGQVTAPDFYSSGNVSAYSDARLKSDVYDIDGALDAVMKLRPVKYKLKGSDNHDNHIGFIAQEVLPVIPEVVSTYDGYMAIDYSKIVAVLVGAIHAQQKQIDALVKSVGVSNITPEC